MMARKIEGRNPVREILKADKMVYEILVAEGVKRSSIKEILELASEKNIQVNFIDRDQIDQMTVSQNNQGIVALVQDYQYAKLHDVLQEASAKFIVICDGIKDPHNLGAIIRTADAAGADAVVIPKNRATEITPIVTKVSVGAAEYMSVVQVTNISRTLEELKENGFWIAAADMDGDREYYEADLTGKIGLVVGSEGSGIRRLVKEKCDFIVRIPMNGHVSSLNASVAASVMMYEVVRQNYGKN